ncbi:CHD3-type chromatin-remodeling factor PICKLE [Nymphaea colorata]|nr:CHD3-type chromatin-remodeling factor PICKLE [Nymphaea colorata]
MSKDMTSMAERLRIRSGRKPLYNDDDVFDEYMEPVTDGRSSHSDKRQSKVLRDDAKEDSCQACGGNGQLVYCYTCTYSYHLKCLLPPLKIAPEGSWSCPECVNPLSEIDKILDCEMRPYGSNETDDSKEVSKQKFVKQYLVKWKRLSYLHCSWVPDSEFQKAFKSNPRLRTKLNNFHRQMDLNGSDEDWVAIRPEWTTVDRILATRKGSGEREYLVKWKDLPYDECYWEVESDICAFKLQLERFNSINDRKLKSSFAKSKSSTRDGKDSKRKQSSFKQYEESPKFLTGGSLHPYQLEGLNFLRFSWAKQTHVILADEMGLGKTIQSIAFLASLFEEKMFPHLVVAPLSTLRNWEREFATWAPHMNVVLYVGSANARSVIRQHEFYFPKSKLKKLKKKRKSTGVTKNKQDMVKFDVLLTSYEMINMDTVSLKPIKWECMIVDEGHRLKNKDSKLFNSLKLYSTNHRVLLTGTPLQNNLDELFMLMHFLDAGKFASLEEFQEEFKDINQEEQVARLHKMLAPHLLRRVKKDVMKDLPPKKELILRVELSAVQKEYYRAVLTRNYQVLTRKGGPQLSLINVVMELRKICCHAYMIEGAEPDVKDESEAYRKLLDSSGKLHLLDKMMVKLKEQGHRVLIYSQFRHMLDILEDYMSYKNWSYERIDGMISGADRQIRIDRFNAKNSTRFCFLLSTRAGGLGINLATADTVIIYDSDWNPHADLQAMARAHRLGQTNKVMIYRLVTRGTIEERMMQMTKKKMVLEHLVVGRLKNQMLNQEELDDIIRYGSKELFADENDESGKSRHIHYDDTAIDRLLDREQVGGEEASVTEDEDDEFLKAFKVANFEYIDEVEAAAANEVEARKQAEANASAVSSSDRASYWEELLKDRYDVHQVEEFTALGKGKRSRKQMVLAEDDDLAGLEDVTSDAEEDEAEWMDSESFPSRNAQARKIHGSRKKHRVDVDSLPLMDGEGKSFRVLGFNRLQRAAFVQILMRFGLGEYDWREFVPRLKNKSLEEIKEYGKLFLTHISEEITDSPYFSDGVPKEGLRISDVLVRVAILQLIGDKVKLLSEKLGAPLFSEDVLSRFPGLMNGRVWKEEHDLCVLRAVMKHGYGRWQAIIEDRELGIQEIVCQEQNLPYLNSSTMGNVLGQEGAHFPNSGVTKANGPGVVSEAAMEDIQENTKGNQLQQESYVLSESQIIHFREVQRRLVEFVKKRVILLEKALSLEYQKTLFDGRTCGSANEEIELDPKVNVEAPLSADTPSPNSFDGDLPVYSSLSVLEPIGAIEILGAACNSEPNRFVLPRLYNEMCKLLNDNEHDAVQAYIGNKSAASRLRKNMRQLDATCEEVFRILSVQQTSSHGGPNMESNGLFRSEESQRVTSASASSGVAADASCPESKFDESNLARKRSDNSASQTTSTLSSPPAESTEAAQAGRSTEAAQIPPSTEARAPPSTELPQTDKPAPHPEHSHTPMEINNVKSSPTRKDSGALQNEKAAQPGSNVVVLDN